MTPLSEFGLACCQSLTSPFSFQFGLYSSTVVDTYVYHVTSHKASRNLMTLSSQHHRQLDVSHRRLWLERRHQVRFPYIDKWHRFAPNADLALFLCQLVCSIFQVCPSHGHLVIPPHNADADEPVSNLLGTMIGAFVVDYLGPKYTMVSPPCRSFFSARY